MLNSNLWYKIELTSFLFLNRVHSDMTYNILGSSSIDDGSATDAYFLRTEEALEGVDRNPEVVAEITESQKPDGMFRVLSGLSDVAELFKGIPVDIDALPEGQLFDGGPVLRIKGNYLDFARYETSLLGFLSQASAFATAATEVRYAAQESTVMSFGARHLNPAIAPVLERNSLIAGLDGISHVAAGTQIGEEAVGTMPHALIIPFGRNNQEQAWKAFDDAVDNDVPRIALCDTFTDEKDEVIRAVDALGDRLDGVRLDTTSSRRGKFDQIIQEVRWELDREGRQDVDIIVSGGIGPETMEKLKDLVDGFGVGGYISDADPLDFGLDIIEVEGDSIAKRGKFSGVKEVYRTPEGKHKTLPQTEDAPSDWDSLYEPLLRDGKVVRDFSIDYASQVLRDDVATVGASAVQSK